MLHQSDLIDIMVDFYNNVSPFYLKGSDMIVLHDKSLQHKLYPEAEKLVWRISDDSEFFRLIHLAKTTIRTEINYFTRDIRFSFDSALLEPILTVPDIIAGFYLYLMIIDTTKRTVMGICENPECRSLIYQEVSKLGAQKLFCSCRAGKNAKKSYIKRKTEE